MRVDDFVTSGGKPVGDPADFGNSWTVNVGRRRHSAVSISVEKLVNIQI